MKRVINELVLRKRNILSLLSLISVIVLLVEIFKIDLLPTKYLVLGIIVITIIQMLAILITNFKIKVYRIIGTIILVLAILINCVGIYYIHNTNNFIDKSFNQKDIKYTSTYYVVSSSKNEASDKEQIKDTVYYYENTANKKKALKELKDDIEDVKTESVDDISGLFTDVKNQDKSYMLVEKESYSIMFDLDKTLKKDDYKVVYKYKVTTTEKRASKDSETFNIYVGGNDFTGSLMDFNMIVSVNTNTHKILLTSIPRDYYIPVAGYNGSDTLSYIGPLGIQTSIASISNFFNIDIDYYVKINTSSLVGIVDEVGGITYCSDYEYKTTHALVINSYNDSGAKFYVKKGCQRLNGIQTLTVARERNAFPGRDRQRQKNCQAIMIAIFKELISTNTITNYTGIMDAVADLYETNLPKEVISTLAKDVINNGNKWTIETQSVDGTDGKDYVHLTKLKDWVMHPNTDSVSKATKKISKILK